jgi:hypothetical protein
MTGDRILQITPAAAGWRTVEVMTGALGPIWELDDEQLFGISPIACFALVHDADADNRFVRAVRAEDWPAYFWVVDEHKSEILDYLGPGEELTDLHRSEARQMIEAARGGDST